MAVLVSINLPQTGLANISDVEEILLEFYLCQSDHFSHKQFKTEELIPCHFD